LNIHNAKSYKKTFDITFDYLALALKLGGVMCISIATLLGTSNVGI
jgi:hypothetical protein